MGKDTKEPLGRRCYHRKHLPKPNVRWRDDHARLLPSDVRPGSRGSLYVAGQNATEANAEYFRSMKYEPKTPEPKPSPAVTGGKVGKSYKVSGNTYKVTSNKRNAATFAKAKNAKKYAGYFTKANCGKKVNLR